MNKSKSSNKQSSIWAFIFILIIDLAFLYYLKYRNQNISLSEFNILNFGNLLNLFTFLIIAIGLLIIKLKIKSLSNINYFWFSIMLLQVFLIISFLLYGYKLPFGKYYALGQSGNRLFVGFIYMLYQFLLFVFMFSVWLSINKTKNLIFIRAVINSAILFFAIIILSFVFIVVKENQFDEKLTKRKNDNIAVVLGAAVWSDNKPSPSLAARVDRALSLLDTGEVNSIYLTGSNAPGELAESEVAYQYIESKRKPTENIFIEKNTTSTNEQISFIKNYLLKKNKNKNIIIISDSYHLVRIIEISKFHNIKVQAVPSKLNLTFENALYFKFREALALVVFWFFAY
ncbi:MAG: YdcF family protein [Ignavibacterium sp.]|jgi:vancomycin permeability regulator SanA|nr:YdcF family protein [Ignavibacterium sp.]